MARPINTIVADYDSKTAQLKAQMKTLNETSGAGERIIELNDLSDINDELAVLFKELLAAIRS